MSRAKAGQTIAAQAVMSNSVPPSYSPAARAHEYIARLRRRSPRIVVRAAGAMIIVQLATVGVLMLWQQRTLFFGAR